MAKATKKLPAMIHPGDGLQIEVGWQSDGGVYVLESLSKSLIRRIYPEAVINPVIVVGFDDSEDIDRFQRPHWEQVARMLTGLTPEQIRHLGGVRLYDHDAKKIIWRWNPPTSNSE